jgi:hypothetical protein
MAQRRIKGTLALNLWEFYEASNGIAFAHGTTTANAGNGVYFINNSTGGEMVDIYRADFSTSVIREIQWYVGGPNSISGTPLVGTTDIMNMDPSQGAPVGQVVPAELIKITGGKIWRQRDDAIRNDAIALNGFGPILTLQPGWGLVALANNTAAGEFINFNLWYQVITDQLRPVT